jgi:hypothetical protein
MRKPHHPSIRELLRQHPDGLTISAIQHTLCISKDATVRRCLEVMPDAYIDRWTTTRNSRGQFLAVWCVVVPPENCPYPTDRYNRVETKWATTP